jgi:beta-galactosidase
MLMKRSNCIIIFILLLLSCTFVYGQREIASLDGEWNFYKGDDDTMELKFLPWEKVMVPHSWNAEDCRNVDYYRGPGLYTKIFSLPKNFNFGKRLFIRFEGVNNKVQVFLNKRFVDSHKGAFNAFCMEITPYVKAEYNTLLVRVDNSRDNNIPPTSGDFPMFGGIDRSVSLIQADPLCILPLEPGASGVYIRQTEVNDRKATLDITTKILNAYMDEKEVQVKITLFDHLNQPVKSMVKDLKAPFGGIATSKHTLEIENPVLWNGRSNPYLYRAFFEVIDKSVVVDTLSKYVGLRYFHIDPKKGFFLNGKPYEIRGVNKYQDRQGKGSAMSREEIEEDIDLILEMGANAVRTPYYPHSDYFYSLCDQYGILVWTENPLIDGVGHSSEFQYNMIFQLRETINQHYNHPSIIFWGLFSELKGKDDPLSLVANLNEIVRRMDPERLIVATSDVEGRQENLIPDLFACNVYPGWNSGKPEEMKLLLQKWNKSLGEKGIGIGEYGAGASIHQHEPDRKEAPDPAGKWHPEEWQATVHEISHKQIEKSPFVWGSFIWSMFDSANPGKNAGDTEGLDDRGLVTYDRKVKKDAFYYYKARWSKDPFAYITSRRFTEHTNKKTDIKIYSNCKKLRLFINGADKGEKSGKDGIFIWKNVQLDEGSNLVYTKGTGSEEGISDQCLWELKPGK